MRITRSCFNAEQSVSVILPSQDGGVCKPRPKGFGANKRSWRSSRFSSSVVQVGVINIVLSMTVRAPGKCVMWFLCSEPS